MGREAMITVEGEHTDEEIVAANQRLAERAVNTQAPAFAMYPYEEGGVTMTDTVLPCEAEYFDEDDLTGSWHYIAPHLLAAMHAWPEGTVLYFHEEQDANQGVPVRQGFINELTDLWRAPSTHERLTMGGRGVCDHTKVTLTVNNPTPFEYPGVLGELLIIECECRYYAQQPPLEAGDQERVRAALADPAAREPFLKMVLKCEQPWGDLGDAMMVSTA